MYLKSPACGAFGTEISPSVIAWIELPKHVEHCTLNRESVAIQAKRRRTDANAWVNAHVMRNQAVARSPLLFTLETRKRFKEVVGKRHIVSPRVSDENNRIRFMVRHDLPFFAEIRRGLILAY